MKIAEKMFPIMADTAKWQASLTLSMKFPNEDEEAEEKREGYAIKSIVLVPNYTKIKAFYSWGLVDLKDFGLNGQIYIYIYIYNIYIYTKKEMEIEMDGYA